MQTPMIDMTQLLSGFPAASSQGKGTATDFAQLLQLFAGAQTQGELPLTLPAEQDGAQPGAESEALAAFLEALGAGRPVPLPELPEQGAEALSPGAASVAEAIAPQAQQTGTAQQPMAVQQPLTAQQPVTAQQFVQSAQTPLVASDLSATNDEPLDEGLPKFQRSVAERSTAEPAPSRSVPEGEAAKPMDAAPVQAKGEAPSRQLPAALSAVSPTDVRFAALIQPRAQQGEAGRSGETARFEALAAASQGQAGESSRVESATSGQGQSDLGSLPHRNGAAEAAPLPAGSGAETSQPFTLEPARPAAEPAVPAGLRLTNGTLLPDNQLLNQVVERFSLRGQGEGSRMTLRLHPEELGELRMELLMEKGVLKAHILAQNPQVQEVLERNLFRLREALEGQGLKLDSCEIGLDNRQQGEGREWFGARQHPQPAAPRHLASRIAPVEIAPLRQAGLNGAGGISLRI